jgi:hypothetical protein
VASNWLGHSRSNQFVSNLLQGDRDINSLKKLTAKDEKDLAQVAGHHWKERPIGPANFICPSTGERQGQKVGVGG